MRLVQSSELSSFTWNGFQNCISFSEVSFSSLFSYIVILLKFSYSFSKLWLNENIYICKYFSLYDINNKIEIQFCMNTFDYVILFFSMRMNTISSLQYISLRVIVLLSHAYFTNVYNTGCTEENI